MSLPGFNASPEEMRSVAGNLSGIIMQAANAVSALRSMKVNPSDFSTLGAAVASMNAKLEASQVNSLTTLLSLLQEFNDAVRKVADIYQEQDRKVADAYAGRQTELSKVSSTLWSSPSAERLSAAATGDSLSVRAEPGSVDNVLGYLRTAGIGNLGDRDFADPVAFARWLDAGPANQQLAGVIGVYQGVARDLGDVPGGVRSGDIVVLAATGGDDPVIAVVGDSGRLYNHGLVQPSFTGLADTRVYRPISAA
ncbi:uncharacterized protein YukE [Crossiella equi]|uniref:Uncharacterized protein YukE n=1 Tax=Crossiella equi TaxID=130796 RepID=A0ABS5A4K6_9PSEU|nr:WXG100 family type VII secretion target [Crossiella equi]MBP2471513.1 uncharacterized protein YukE [Crossiella equi]